MQPLNVILPKEGYAWVGVLTAAGLDVFKVTDQLQSACGGGNATPCAHIEAVKAYRRLDGREPLPSPESCPICGEQVWAQADRWRCAASAGHYWRWRGEQSGVKAFLTEPHPAKQGAFYEQSIEERDAFLEQIRHRGYSPYQPKGV